MSYKGSSSQRNVLILKNLSLISDLGCARVAAVDTAPRSRRVFVPNRGTRLIEGMVLRRLRESQGLTQQEVAERLGFKRANSISKFERGHRGLSTDSVRTYMAALGKTIEDFLRLRALVIIERPDLLRKHDPEHAEDLIAEAREHVRPRLDPQPSDH